MAGTSVAVVGGGRDKHLSQTMNSVLLRHFDSVRASRGRSKSRVLHAGLPHPPERQRPGAPWPRRTSVPTPDGTLALSHHGGVFAGGRLDPGTALLLDALAEIDLANTRIVAPRAGRLGEIGVRQGQYVTAGTQLMGLVPDVVWVVANMKETQMRDVRVGQPVELSIDALGRETLRGRVERISPATGSEFSVIRPDNATGNFTKVAQRIPVRVRIEPNQPLAERLSPGMSVVARIDTAAEPT